MLKPGAEQQLVVRAKYSDGRVRGRHALGEVQLPATKASPSVDDSGRVKMNGHGEAAITLWYSSRVLYARLAVPYPEPGGSGASTRDFQPAQLHRRTGAREAEGAEHRAFRRRRPTTSSSAAPISTPPGILPTAEEVEHFLADTSADKRAKLIDRLLERDEFVDYWAYKWSDLLLVSSRKLRSNAMWSLLQLDSRKRQGEQALGPVRARDLHRHRATRGRTAR